jgi:hypothetical protein
MKNLILFAVTLIAFLNSAMPVSAHAFGAMYTLPIPFWLYSFAGAAALLLSFLIIGFFINLSKPATAFPAISLHRNRVVLLLTSGNAQVIYKTISFLLFLFTILSGLIGEDISAYNFNMTFFWVIFVLGFIYLTLVLGDIWRVVNPWKISIDIFERMSGSTVKGTYPYPERLGFYPAFLLYVVFIMIELSIGTTPFSLSVFLLEYTLITFFAVYLFGKETWFRCGEFFSVFFRFIGYVSVMTKEKNNILLRIPFSGLIDKKASDFSMLLFILFMLSSTAFDGFRETNIWLNIYWEYLYNLSPQFFSSFGYQFIELIALLASPFIFLFFYLVTIIVMKQLVVTKLSITELALSFAFSLLPIALVYNIAHYFTLFFIQGQHIIRLISDPFGWNWNLFGTAGFSANPGILAAGTVWHTQVGLILLGHIVSVIIAHFIALRIFTDHKKALLSQIPMLVLMIIYTVIGLWILSQPIAVGS